MFAPSSKRINPRPDFIFFGKRPCGIVSRRQRARYAKQLQLAAPDAQLRSKARPLRPLRAEQKRASAPTRRELLRRARFARTAGTAGYPASREGENMLSARSKTAGAGPSGFGSARHVPLALSRCTLRRCNLSRGAPPRLQRCRFFSSASSHRTRAWRQRYQDRLPLWSERSA